MEQYLTHTDYALWGVIVNGDALAVASASDKCPIPPKNAEQKLARKNELKAKSTLSLAIPDEHLLKFHGIKDAKTLWEAIKTMFGGNKESKKMQKTILKQQYENFTTSRSEGLDKTPDSFVDIDELSMDDLYNNLKDKAPFPPQRYADDFMFSFFVNQSNSPQMDNEDLEQIDTDDLEEMDLKWLVAMLTMRALRNQGNRNRDTPRRIVLVETLANALVVQDRIGLYSSSISDSEVRDNSITELKNQLSEALREKDDLKLKLEKFQTSSMKLTTLINSQISVNNKSGVGFDSQMNENELHDCHINKIPLPYTRNYMPLRPDLSFAGLDDSVYKTNVSETISSVPRIESTASKSTKDSLEQPKDVRPSAPIFEEWESDSNDDSVFRPKPDQTKPNFTKINFVKSDENTRKSVIEQHAYRQAENLRKIVTKLGQVLVNTTKQSSSRATTSISTARPINIVAPKSKVNDASPTKYSYFKAHSPVIKDFNQKSTAKTNHLNEKVKTTRVNNVTIAGSKALVNAAVGNRKHVVKSSACWIWRPTGKVIDHISKDNGSYMPKRFDYVDPQGRLKSDQGIFDSGCFRHMTGNKSYLTDYQDINAGFVAFAGILKGGKIIRKSKIRTRKLDFKDVYFVKELKFNLFTKIGCLVLSPDFKLLDESQVLLKVPKHNNMYSFDIKNVVPSGGETLLEAYL
ncbi:hypothetical protein Tco_1465134 [Tanacetum coccineum]